jgi:hypothetical protein
VTRLEIERLEDQDVQRSFEQLRPSCHRASVGRFL